MVDLGCGPGLYPPALKLSSREAFMVERLNVRRSLPTAYSPVVVAAA